MCLSKLIPLSCMIVWTAATHLYQPQQMPKPVLTKLKTRIDFKDAELYISNSAISDPVEAHEHLVVRHGNTTKMLRDLNDLEGRVSIVTGAGALEYVRLLTSADTWDMWPQHLLEVTNRSRVRSGIPGTPSGFSAALSDRDFRRWHFADAAATAKPGGY